MPPCELTASPYLRTTMESVTQTQHPEVGEEVQALLGCLDTCTNVWLDPSACEPDVRTVGEALQVRLAMCGAPLCTQASATPRGTAISTQAAADCFGDFRRSQLLVRAVDLALATTTARFPGEPITVAYAGCGPWAPLLLVLARRWSGRLRLHLIDVHASAVEQAAALFALIGQSGAIAKVTCADAALLELAEALRPHVVVGEIMQRALSVEPHVAVAARLASQLREGGVLVPHRIVVEAALARIAHGIEAPSERLRIPLAELIDVSVATAPSLLQQLSTAEGCLPAREIVLGADTPAGLNVILATRVELAPGLLLDEYASGLTYPDVLHALGQVRPGQRYRFQYRLGVSPRFTCTLVRDAVTIREGSGGEGLEVAAGEEALVGGQQHQLLRPGRCGEETVGGIAVVEGNPAAVERDLKGKGCFE